MIELTAQIKLETTGNLNSVECNISGNNISSEISDILGKKVNSKNPVIIGATKLGDGAILSNGVDYFIGKQACDFNGLFSTPYIINIGGQNINSLTIAFDTQSKRHPHHIDVNGTKFYDDDSIFTISNLGGLSSVKITIDNWNTPNCPVIITGIYVNIDIIINKRNLIGLSSTIMSRSDLKFPSYGIISNTGSLEFNDYNGEIADYAEMGILTSDLAVKIMLKDTLSKREEQVGIYETREWDYDNNNRSVSVSLKDDLEEWQDIHIDSIEYDPRNPYNVIADGKLSNFYKWLQTRTPTKYNMLSFSELDSKTREILENTIIPYPLLNSGSLWQQWTKICEVGGLYIYKSKNGRTVCTYTYGS